MNAKQLGQNDDEFELDWTELFEPSVAPIRGILTANQTFSFVVRHFDSLVRRQKNVFEFCSDSRCLLRLALRRADVDLPGRFSSRRGALIGELHLWNEQIPPLPSGGSNFAWAMRLRRQMRKSFALLAASVRADARFKEIEFVCAKTQFGANKRRAHFERLIKSFGFEQIEELSCNKLREKWMDFGDCIYLWILSRAFNPVLSWHPRPIRLSFRRLWMSRETLLAKYPARSHLGAAPLVFNESHVSEQSPIQITPLVSNNVLS